MVEVVKFRCIGCGKPLSIMQSDAVKVRSVLHVACSTTSLLIPDDLNGRPPKPNEPTKPHTSGKKKSEKG